MQIEEIRLLSEAITALGTDGKDAFLWWIGYKVFDSILSVITLILAVFAVAFALLRAVSHDKQVKEIYHALTDDEVSYGTYDSGDHRRVLRRIQELRRRQ